MTDIQLYLTIGIPSFLVLIGIFLNQFGINLLGGRITSVETRLLSIEGDLRRFYQLIGEHGGKIEMIEKKIT